MADTDDPRKDKKTLAGDAVSEPGTAPEFKGAGSALNDPAPEEPYEDDNKDAKGDDGETDKAVDDIMKKDGDDALKAQDEKAEKTTVKKLGAGERFKNAWSNWWGSPRKRWGTIGVLVVVLGVLGGVPFTRYTIAGVVLKGTVTVQALDSKTGEPVSGAAVSLGGKTAETDAAGKAKLQVNAGSKKLVVSKQYYTGVTQSELVTFSSNSYKVNLVALGRQVSIKVVNKLTGKAVANAVVSVQGGNTKTKADGTATVVLPSGATVQEANVSLDGYNTTKVSIFAAGDLAKNTFGVTPAGKLYFLSNLSGKLDVVKTDLDGGSRQTVIAGTGAEDRNSTSLLASRDWKYLALLSKRSNDSSASIFLIDTTQGDKLSTIDEGDANFSLVGWSGDRFIYTVDRNNVQGWQANRQALKSFDPVTGHTLVLDQTQGSGTGNQDYQGQLLYLPYLIGDQVVYAKNWQGYGNSPLNGKSAELDSIGADGSGHKVVKTFAPDTYMSSFGYDSVSIDMRLYEPGGIYIDFAYNNQGSFYAYEDGKIASSTNVTADTFYQTPYPTYLLSPSGNSVFWSEQRDGKNTLFTGDNAAKSPKQVASLSDYNTYGWFTDDYLLVSKNSSELYVMPTSGGTPYKVTDYYKPNINYQGYGGGYGGL